ncbi:MAG: hypothetical protein EOP11_16525, partial [Proteobacteria bacterium]
MNTPIAARSGARSKTEWSFKMLDTRHQPVLESLLERLGSEINARAVLLLHENGQVIQRSGWIGEHEYPAMAALVAAMIATGKSLSALGENFAGSPNRFACDSEEMGQHVGLNLVPGHVLRFDERNLGSAAQGIKVPQIGWNSLAFPDDTRPRSPLFAGLEEGAEVYFVHSYYCQPGDEDTFTASRTEFIAPYTSAVWNGANIY